MLNSGNNNLDGFLCNYTSDGKQNRKYMLDLMFGKVFVVFDIILHIYIHGGIRTFP